MRSSTFTAHTTSGQKSSTGSCGGRFSTRPNDGDCTKRHGITSASGPGERSSPEAMSSNNDRPRCAMGKRMNVPLHRGAGAPPRRTDFPITPAPGIAPRRHAGPARGGNASASSHGAFLGAGSESTGAGSVSTRLRPIELLPITGPPE